MEKYCNGSCDSQKLSINTHMVLGNYGNLRNIYSEVGSTAYVHVNLDVLTSNINVLRRCAHNAGILAVVKSNAYGHGVVPVSKHLKSIGIERLGVATVAEGAHLRKAGISGPIHIIGNINDFEMANAIKHDLIITISTAKAVVELQTLLDSQEKLCTNRANSFMPLHLKSSNSSNKVPHCKVHLEIDTGMSRSGCQPEELGRILELCKNTGVHVEGIFTHMAHCTDLEFTRKQMIVFYKTVEPYRDLDMLFHTTNTTSIMNDIGTELDLVRSGKGIYGIDIDYGADVAMEFGFQPAASLHAQATCARFLSAGSHVGYGCTYTCQTNEWIVTIPVGFADFYWRHLSNKGFILRDRTGEKCPMVGTISMNTCTVRVSPEPEPEVGESFTLLTADYDEHTSAYGIANIAGTITSDVLTWINCKVPRYYTRGSDAWVE